MNMVRPDAPTRSEVRAYFLSRTRAWPTRLPLDQHGAAADMNLRKVTIDERLDLCSIKATCNAIVGRYRPSRPTFVIWHPYQTFLCSHPISQRGHGHASDDSPGDCCRSGHRFRLLANPSDCTARQAGQADR